ncbi:MAG: MBOAT family protein [Clostridia bacterium]|nr:MBOAT family protein [Clostridia bacterium]
MVFSSIPFLYFFLPAVLLCYFAVPAKAKDVILLVFSLLFYWWGEPKYALLMVFTITFCYFAGRILESRREKSRESKAILIFSVAVPLGFLAVFKYADFFIGSINSLGADIPLLKLALPIGISFYTFQAISYLIDVNRGDIPAEKSLITLAAYITLFPQLIAGPIVRYSDVADDMKNRKINLKNLSDGIRRFVYGIGKKVLIANLLGTICSVYRDSADPSVLYAWIYAFSYSLQIYFDFSAYSDMAIGLGKILGLNFLENFNYPYISKSITEFWRRWHISLSSWFRDYVYIPLGGNRVKKSRQIFNIMVVWCLTGFWHGAGWTFIAWGLYFGILLLCEKFIWGKAIEKLPKVFRHIYVIFIVIISFVIFNASTFTEAWNDIMNLLGISGIPLVSGSAVYALKSNAILLAIAFFGATPVMKKLCLKYEDKLPVRILEVASIVVVLVVSTAYLVDGSFNPFLYFRF